MNHIESLQPKPVDASTRRGRSPRRPRPRIRYFIYRPPCLDCCDDLRPVAWEGDPELAALVGLTVRLLGGSKQPRKVYWLPTLEVFGESVTWCRRALVLRAGTPTAVASPVPVHALRKYLAWSLVLRPSTAAPDPGSFAGRVVREALDVATTFGRATYTSKGDFIARR